jgi:hypothetical protein
MAEGVQTEYLTVFDGLYLYNVAWSDVPDAVLVRWGDAVRRWGAERGVYRFWAATVMPGYDDLATGRPDAYVRERADGTFYRACWAGAVQSEADWVIVNSFNAWLEGTHIEPSVLYDDTYIRLTAALAADYRASVLGAAPTSTPEIPTPTLAPTPTSLPATPTPTAVVASPTITPTVRVTPTSTMLPTPTLFRLATPTPKGASVPVTVTPLPHGEVTATVGPRRILMPVEGLTPKTCSPLAALLPVLSWAVVLLRRH